MGPCPFLTLERAHGLLLCPRELKTKPVPPRKTQSNTDLPHSDFHSNRATSHNGDRRTRNVPTQQTGRHHHANRIVIIIRLTANAGILSNLSNNTILSIGQIHITQQLNKKVRYNKAFI